MAQGDTLILIERSGLQFFSGGQNFMLNFPLSVVKDLEIIDKETYRKMINDFLLTNNISVANVSLLLSESVCFLSEAMSKDQDHKKAQDEFELNMPFDEPVSIIVENKIIATDRGIYNTLVLLINSLGGKVSMVSPIFLSKDMFNLKTIDSNIAKNFHNNEDLYMNVSFPHENLQPVSNKIESKTKKLGKREVVLISVFAVLVVILIWVLTTSR